MEQDAEPKPAKLLCAWSSGDIIQDIAVNDGYVDYGIVYSPWCPHPDQKQRGSHKQTRMNRHARRAAKSHKLRLT